MKEFDSVTKLWFCLKIPDFHAEKKKETPLIYAGRSSEITTFILIFTLQKQEIPPA